MSKPLIVKLSVGIGTNIAEAEYALKIAKQRKSNRRKFNIEIYNGDKIECNDNICEQKIVDAYLRLEEKLKGSRKDLRDLAKFKYDPKTKLLNKLGYQIEREKLILNNKYNTEKRYTLLFDADSMHYLNKKHGYDKVDKHLEAIGRALKENLRSKIKTKDNIAVREIKDILCNRKHDSAGDEFIIDLECNEKDLKTIAKRYLMNCYNYQEKINEINK